MSSGPSPGFVYGSAASSQSFRDAITSYRRSQYLVAGSTVASSLDSDAFPDDERYDSSIEEDVEDVEVHSNREDDDGLVWDSVDSLDTPVQEHPAPHLAPPRLTYVRRGSLRIATQIEGVTQTTPLLRRISDVESGGSDSNSQLSVPAPYNATEADHGIIRRRSSTNMRSKVQLAAGSSTYGQTLFNSIAILLGIGMLSEPMAFAYAGWGMGTILIIFYGFISCYTAKILARIILSDPRLRSYSDIGRLAFGSSSTMIISALFCLELFAVSVALVTLYADSLHTIIPQLSSNTYKVIGLLFFLPTVFLPLSLLSYTSILGIISTVLIIVVILIDGLSKTESPGSLWTPADTSFGVASWKHLGIAFGLFMAGFSGHAVIPSLARDMVDPEQFDHMINWAFTFATFFYGLIGYAGYLMFGNNVSDEVSKDLMRTPGYNMLINQAALWMLVISPLSKFALATQPLNATIEIMLGVDSPDILEDDIAGKLRIPITGKGGIRASLRIIITLLSVTTSILVPEFESVMAFLGSFSAFIICVVGPIAAKITLQKKCSVFDAFILVIAIVMAVWGTTVAFL